MAHFTAHKSFGGLALCLSRRKPGPTVNLVSLSSRLHWQRHIYYSQRNFVAIAQPHLEMKYSKTGRPRIEIGRRRLTDFAYKQPRHQKSNNGDSAKRYALLLGAFGAFGAFIGWGTGSASAVRFDALDSLDGDDEESNSVSTDSSYQLLQQYLRRVKYYVNKGDHAEVYVALQLALTEARKQKKTKLTFDILHDSAVALSRQELYEDAVNYLQTPIGILKGTVRALDDMGFDAEEATKQYLGRDQKIAKDMSKTEYEDMQRERRDTFKELVKFETLKCEILSGTGDDAQHVHAVSALIYLIEKEMGPNFALAPNFAHADDSLSKTEIFDTIKALRSQIWSTQPLEASLPLSQRMLALEQAIDGGKTSCPQIEAIRWLSINLAGAAVDAEIRKGNRTPEVEQLYTEARQWNELALELGRQMRDRRGREKKDDPLWNENCDYTCIAMYWHLAGIAMFIEKDMKAGRDLMEEGLELARTFAPDEWVRPAETFVEDMDAGTLSREETADRDGELFGYCNRLEREMPKAEAQVEAGNKKSASSDG